MDLDKKIWNSPKEIQKIIFDFAYDLTEDLRQIHFKLLEKMHELRLLHSKHLFDTRIINKLPMTNAQYTEYTRYDYVGTNMLNDIIYQDIEKNKEVDILINNLYNYVKYYKLSRSYLHEIIGHIPSIIYNKICTKFNDTGYLYDHEFTIDNEGLIRGDLHIDKTINIYEYLLFDSCEYCNIKLKIRKYGHARIEVKRENNMGYRHIYLRFCDKCINNPEIKILSFINKKFYNDILVPKLVSESESESEQESEQEDEPLISS